MAKQNDADFTADLLVLDKWRHGTYASQRLFQVEQRCSNFEREGLAFDFVVKRLRQFLLDQEFLLETDHRHVEFTFAPNEELPETVSSKITR